VRESCRDLAIGRFASGIIIAFPRPAIHRDGPLQPVQRHLDEELGVADHPRVPTSDG